MTSSELAAWATAFGTIGAVVVALWLARRSDAERLIFGSNLTDRQLEIYIVNASDRPIHLRDGDFELGRFRPYVDDGFGLMLSQQARLPLRLGPRDTTTLEAHVSYEPSYLPDRLRKEWMKRSRFDRALYLTVVTGQGKRVRYCFPRALLREMLRRAPQG